MNTIKLLAIMIILVMVSACLNQPTGTSSSHASSNPSHSFPTASPRGVIDVYPPRILDFNYTPTKVVWDKVYDVRVSFKVVDDESIERVVLKFVPMEYEYFITKYGMRPEDYQKVFPSEKERVYELKPVDGVFDKREEEFSVEIKNITGGREYRIIITAEDDAGNTRTFEYKTPYIRQYENFGRQLYEKGIIVGTPYYVWYRNDLSNWHDYGHKYTPLMGTYKSNDPIVILKHIDWATGYGINLFLVSWSGYEEGDLKFFDENLQLMFNISISHDIYIAILYESVGRLISRPPPVYISLDDERNVEILTSDLRYLAKMYFSKQNYLRIEGKPIVYLYESKGYTGNLENAISRVRETITNEYGTDIFLISDHAHPLADTDDPVWIDRLKQFDGVTVWLGGYLPDGKYVGGSYTKQLKINYSKWYNLTGKLGILLIPFGTPEFDNRLSWGSPNSIPILRDKNSSKQNLQTLLEYSSELPDRHKMIFWGTFNDFFESTTLEPAQQYEFSSLDGLREVLEEYLENLTSPKPQVLGFNWTPTKVVWDKVYDLKVSFKLSYPPDEISSVKLIFKPENYSYFITEYGMRREDYYKVFPNDSRVYELKPVDGVLDEPIEEFEVNITNITGGAEYWIITQIQTKNGRTVEYKRKTPYIRQYENFGRQLYEKGIIVGANYFPLYPVPHPWVYLEPMYVHPILGKYDVRDETVVSKHIDWATGHGINEFFITWPLDWATDSMKVLNNLNILLNSPLGNQILFSFQVEGVDRAIELNHPEKVGWRLYLHSKTDWSNVIYGDNETIGGLLIINQYLTRENYLRINTQPLLFLYDSGRLYGNVQDFVNEIKLKLDNPMVMSNYAHPWAATSNYTINNTGGWIESCEKSGHCELIVVSKHFDAWTVWAAGWYTPVKYPLSENYPLFLRDGYLIWKELAKKYNKVFVPSVIPGFIDLRHTDVSKLPRNDTMFSKELRAALDTAYVPSNREEISRIIKIDTFNEFGEATGIEPTREEGFIFLKTLKEVLEEYVKNQEEG